MAALHGSNLINEVIDGLDIDANVSMSIQFNGKDIGLGTPMSLQKVRLKLIFHSYTLMCRSTIVSVLINLHVQHCIA